MVRPYQSGRQLRRRRCGMGRGRMKFDGGVDFNQPRNSFYHVVLDAFHLSPFSLSLIHLFSPPPSLSKTAYIPFFIYIIQPSAVVESCVAACTIETRGREGRLLLPACQSKPPSILLYKERSGAEFERNWLDGRLLAAAPPAVSCRVVSLIKF